MFIFYAMYKIRFEILQFIALLIFAQKHLAIYLQKCTFRPKSVRVDKHTTIYSHSSLMQVFNYLKLKSYFLIRFSQICLY